MSVDFFKYAENVAPVLEFGLIDETPAKVVYDNKDEWNAVVKSNNRNDYVFAPLDKKLRVPKEHGGEESLCECLLRTEKTIAFIEFKARKTQHTQKAILQLENTIRIYKQNHNIDAFDFKLAFICNKKRPYYNESKNSVCSDFTKRNNVALHIGKIINEFDEGE